MWRIIFRRTFYPHLLYAAWLYAAFWACKATSLDGVPRDDSIGEFGLFSVYAMPFAMYGMFRWTKQTLRLSEPEKPRRWTVWRVVRTVGAILAVLWFTLFCVGLALGGGWIYAGTAYFLVEAIPACVLALKAGSRGHFEKEGEIERQEREKRAEERRAQAEVNRQRRQVQREEAAVVARQRADERAVRQACRDVERFCAHHAALIRDEMPPVVLRTHLADLRAMTDPKAARAASRELLAELQPIVERAKQQRLEEARERAEREERRQQLLAEIASFEAQADKVRSSGLDPDVIEDEIAGIEQHVRELRDQVAMLSTLQREGGVR